MPSTTTTLTGADIVSSATRSSIANAVTHSSMPPWQGTCQISLVFSARSLADLGSYTQMVANFVSKEGCTRPYRDKLSVVCREWISIVMSPYLQVRQKIYSWTVHWRHNLESVLEEEKIKQLFQETVEWFSMETNSSSGRTLAQFVSLEQSQALKEASLGILYYRW
jgi:hypothetical protein